MNFDLIVSLDYRQSHTLDFANMVSQLPEVQRVAYRRSTYEQYVPARGVITDPAYQALQELNSLKLENLPRPVEGGTYGFVFQVSAVGPTEFARYAAQLGLDVKKYSDHPRRRGSCSTTPACARAASCTISICST